MSNLGKVIKHRLAELGKTQGWLAERAGVSNNAVSKWIKTGKISRENAIVVAVHLKITVSDLLIDFQPTNSVTTRAFGGSFDGTPSEFVHIPMVKLRLSAGVTGFQTEPESRDGSTFSMRRHWIDQSALKPDNLVAIVVKGESMEPGMYDGDVVVIDTGDKRPVDGVVFAVNYEGEAVIKRFARDAGDWWLTSDNPDQRKFHRKVCRGDACIIVGRVVLKESKRI